MCILYQIWLRKTFSFHIELITLHYINLADSGALSALEPTIQTMYSPKTDIQKYFIAM